MFSSFEPTKYIGWKEISPFGILIGLFAASYWLLLIMTPSSTFVLPLCPFSSPHLKGPIKPLLTVLSDEQIMSANPAVQRGGRFRPADCEARSRAAVVVAYRDRAAHLQMLLSNLHPVMQRQQLDYTIFVVEQAGTGIFNKGTLFNAAFMEINATGRFDCFVFHDVDVYPENDSNSYGCRAEPTLLATAMNKFRYKPLYDHFFGAAVSLSARHFTEINGYPNVYWGWGGEDDDIGRRVQRKFGSISRSPLSIGRYTMATHKSDEGNPKNKRRFDLVNTAQRRFDSDGLNSLNYTLLTKQFRPLYTWFFVDVGYPVDFEAD
ncbi:beta-1,4-galactosyltransferase 3-like isoform X1 [Paramacrobiotus metropolitanus]|uniref:beta-1,4-galactosyltransferase 3-like isoform X1 n=1 Tax=Paramacrobiotus metropolitanus TaxID=2943436 RepID=UPI002445D699|nr:beta-1,4-galactosyltransferase 3-like isoform X1 [Paramacrobiotus metropolitanus]